VTPNIIERAKQTRPGREEKELAALMQKANLMPPVKARARSREDVLSD